MIRFEKILILSGAVILGLGIAVLFQIATGEKNVILAQSEFKDATEYKQKLLKEIDVLYREEKEKEERLAIYRENNSSSQDIMKQMEEDLLKNRILLGSDAAKGPGLILKFTDGEKKEGEGADSMDSWLKTIHNEDMLKVINGLQLNGGEAIEINGERVTVTTEIYCSWAFISINGKKLPAPFVVKAIGDQKKLLAYASSTFGHVKIMENRGIKVNVLEANHMEFEGSIELKAPLYLIEE